MCDFIQYLSGSTANSTESIELLHFHPGIYVFLSAILSRIGFILVQIGCVPVEDIYILVLENLLDFLTVLLTYGFLGHYIAYGQEEFLNILHYRTDFNDPELEHSLFRILRGLAATLSGSAILRTFLAGRLHLFAVILLSFTYSASLTAVAIRWLWREDGIMNSVKFNHGKYKILDSGGAIITHITASITGFIAALILGRRLTRVKKLDPVSVDPMGKSNTIIGYLIVYVGLFGSTLPSTEPQVYFLRNGLLAFVAGLLVTSICNSIIHRKNVLSYWNVVRCFQGGIAGFVAVSAFINTKSLLTTFITTSLISIVSLLVVYGLHYTFIEDNCNIIAVHLLSAFLSALIAPVCCAEDDENKEDSDIVRLINYIIVQFFTCLTVIAYCTLVMCILFLLMMAFGLLRNKREEQNHSRAVSYLNKLPPKLCVQRLFSINRKSIYVTKDKILKNSTKVERTFKSEGIEALA